MQTRGKYNKKNVFNILKNKPVQTYHLKNGKSVKLDEKNIPLYLAICPSVIFERPLVKIFKKYMNEKNLLFTKPFGYFDIEIYKLKK